MRQRLTKKLAVLPLLLLWIWPGFVTAQKNTPAPSATTNTAEWEVLRSE